MRLILSFFNLLRTNLSELRGFIKTVFVFPDTLCLIFEVIALFTKLSIAEKIIYLFFILVLQNDISQLLVFSTLPEPIVELSLRILTNFLLIDS